MLETISKKVAPSDEQSTINVMSHFGWNVKSSQEINVQDSHLERRGDAIYNVTKKENYVKLVFERNTAIPNYNQLVALEKEYFDILAEKPKNVLLVPLIVITVIGFMTNIAYISLPAFLATLADIIIHGVRHSKWNAKRNEVHPRVLAQAKQLLY